MDLFGEFSGFLLSDFEDESDPLLVTCLSSPYPPLHWEAWPVFNPFFQTVRLATLAEQLENNWKACSAGWFTGAAVSLPPVSILLPLRNRVVWTPD